jgi:linoleoyl-CoA desaturase
LIFHYSSRTISIKIPKNEIINLIIFKLLYLGYMLLLPIYLLPFAWHAIVLAFFLNHFLVSLLFVGVLGVSHLSDYVAHPLPDQNNRLAMSWPKLQLCTSVDYNAGSVFLNWTLGGFNAHALHHLLPGVCHVHYLELLPLFRDLAGKHGLLYMEMPYAQSLAAHFRYLKAMGKQQVFVPTPFER